MRDPSCRPSRPSLLKRLVAWFRPARRLEDRSDWPEPPPDAGVREPRRPRPSGFGGAALLDPPSSDLT
jgi:hypothetical protein